MMPRLPPEVLEHILVNTRDEDFLFPVVTPYLSASSLVCKDWRPVAQSLLFKKLDFPVSKPLSRVLAFLKAAPHISAYVRILRIWRYEHDRKHQNCGIQPHILHKLLVALPRLQELDLFRVVLLGWKNTVPFPVVPVNLRSLVLTDLVIDFYATRSAAKAFDFLRLFHARKMRVSGGELPRSSSVPSPPVGYISALPGASLPAVRELSIFGKSLFVELNDGKGGLNPTQLSSFSMQPTQRKQLPFYGRFIRRYSGTIRHLSFHIGRVLYRMDETEIIDIQWGDLNVAACTQLKSLRLHWTHDGYHSGERQDTSVREAYRAILSSTPTHLRELSMVVGLDRMQASAETFAELAPYVAAVLVHGAETFNDLESVTLEISEHFDLEKSTSVMKALLPEHFLDRQLLHFKAHPESF